MTNTEIACANFKNHNYTFCYSPQGHHWREIKNRKSRIGRAINIGLTIATFDHNCALFCSQRNLRCLAFAKLYFKVGEYEQARRYVSSYLSAKPLSAEGQLLLGKILEKLGKKEAALEAYRSSYELDSKQNSLVVKSE